VSATTITEQAADAAPAAPAAAQAIGVAREARVFRRLRVRMLRTVARQVLSEARFRVAVIAVVSIIFWVGLFIVFAEGFVFLRSALDNQALRAQTVQAVYNVFFLALTVMLTMSSAIITYGNLFRGDEIAHLLTLPARAERIVLFKFQEGVVFSCWGFMLLGTPMLIAYGVTSAAPWYYYAMILPFMISFVLIPTGLGALLCLLVVYYLPALRLYALVLAGIVVVAIGGAWAMLTIGSPTQDMLTPDWFAQMLGRLRFAEQRLLPSWWLSSGLLEAAHPVNDPANRIFSWHDSLWFLATLSANALFAQLLVVQAGARYFRAGYSGLQGLVPARRRVRKQWVDRLAAALMGWLPRQTRALVIKDLQVFRRDPVQWSQFAIFFGLLALYFVNVRRFNYGDPMRQWLTIVGFMNLGVVGLILSTFTTRFIFPMISLEGRRFWILGTAPLERSRILWAKFLFAALGSVIPCSLLILLSDIMLRVVERSPVVAVIHQLTCLVLCLGLSAMAVGLGARLPNLREPSPSKIAAGFGGTLNLILNMVYILAVVLATAIPLYYWIEGAPSDWQRAASGTWLSMILPWIGLGTAGSVVLGVVVTVLLGAVGTFVPLWIGIRAFEKLEP
jgi:ABC-2 type transport system permease protein